MADFEKTLFLGSAAIIVIGGAFAAGLYSAASENLLYRAAAKGAGAVRLVFEERENLIADGEPVRYLQRARHDGAGVIRNDLAGDDDLVMIAGFFDGANGVRLMTRDGTVLAGWSLSFSEHFPDPSFLRSPPQTDRNVDLHGTLLLPDGAMLTNYEYSGTVKLSRCGEVLWTLEHPSHHSLERAEGGGYWIPGRDYVAPGDRDAFPPFTEFVRDGVDVSDDTIMRVSEQGEILSRKSVMGILYENGLDGVMTATGYVFHDRPTGRMNWDGELTHVNKIAELSSEMAPAFPMFEAGDLLLSLREYNMLFVVDPDDWRVKWHQVGPWKRQHDPEFMPDGTITVFNNNTFRTDLGPGGMLKDSAPLVSNIVRIDPATGRHEIVYGDGEGEAFGTVVRGKQEPMPGGGFLITEFEAGRVFETDAAGDVVWEYLNRYDAERVLEVTEGRVYPADYFTVSDWSCP